MYLFRNPTKNIAIPPKLIYHSDDQNINDVTLTTDDINGIAAGEKIVVNLNPCERIIEVEVISEPISDGSVPVGPIVHHIVLLHTKAGTYAIEKFDVGVHLTKCDSVKDFLKNRKQGTNVVHQLFKQQPKKGKDTIECVLNWLVKSKQLEIQYHWLSFNCKTFSNSLCLFLTGVSFKTSSNFNFIQAFRYSLSGWDRSVIEFHVANFIRPIPLPSMSTRNRLWKWVCDAVDISREIRFPSNLNPLGVIASCVPKKVRAFVSKSSDSSDSTLDHNNYSNRKKMLMKATGVCALVIPCYYQAQGIWWVTAVNLLTVIGAIQVYSWGSNQFRHYYKMWYCHVGTDLKDIIDESISLPKNEYRVSIVCDKAEVFGGHAFLFFIYHDEKGIKFARAELCIAKQQSCSNSIQGDPKVKIKIAETVERARPLLAGIKKKFFATFTRQGDVKNYLKTLKDQKFTFSSLGDHSSGSVNSCDNNQNCASWCFLVLGELGIKIDEPPVKTPRNVVLSARRHVGRDVRELITVSAPAADIIKIYVVCNSSVEFGGHVFLLFEWVSNENGSVVRKFFRAELTIDSNNPSEMSSGRGNIKKSAFVIGLEEGKKLLTDPYPYFASFSYDVIEEKLLRSYIFTREVGYTLSGENSLTQSSNLNDIHNCATFINEVLVTAFNIDLGLDSKKLKMITTPRHIVDLADEHEKSE